MEKKEIQEMLQKGLIRAVFQKKSTGERREIRCTLHPSILPPPPPPNPDKPKRATPGHLVVAWDVEAGGFRSFDPDDLLEEPVMLEVYEK